MRRGFTILELLVASILLGMLVTILTMIFNQSSIAWRTGVASVDDLDEMRFNIATLREEADNAFVFNNTIHRNLGLWNDSGALRNRACDADGSGAQQGEQAELLKKNLSASANMEPSDFSVVSVGSGDASRSFNAYSVNVMSAGPDRQFDTVDDIWSWPDEFE